MRRVLECELDWISLQTGFDTDLFGEPTQYPVVAVIDIKTNRVTALQNEQYIVSLPERPTPTSQYCHHCDGWPEDNSCTHGRYQGPYEDFTNGTRS
jgi:hypothetical protein